jgi:POT family proton-dependent oligopeptide transporter
MIGNDTRPTRNPGAQDDAWTGHPKGLRFLFATEMWERFSYFGMRSLLVLYMVDYLLKPERAADVIGLALLKRALETLSGPLAAQPLASQIYGFYTGLVYLTPVAGGLLADCWLGRKRTVALGAVLMVLGHLMMAFEPLFLFALLMLLLGNGAFKPNIVAQVRGLYAAHDPRCDRAYSIFYVGINIGAFMSPLVCGTLGEAFGWHYGFVSAGVGMAIGLWIYTVGLPTLPPDTPRAEHAAASLHSSGTFGPGFLGLMCLFLPATLFWAAYEQQGNTIALWAKSSTDRHIDLIFWSGEFPASWFQAINPLMIFLFTPLLVAWWTRRAGSGREPATITKLALGCVGIALAYTMMAVVARMTGGIDASWLWLVLFFVIVTVAELHFSPIALSLISRFAPEAARSSFMAMWFATSFTGNLLAGWLGGLWSTLTADIFFLVVAAIAGLASVLILILRPTLHALLGN